MKLRKTIIQLSLNTVDTASTKRIFFL